MASTPTDLALRRLHEMRLVALNLRVARNELLELGCAGPAAYVAQALERVEESVRDAELRVETLQGKE
jgi:hypothetical protein